MDTLCLDVDNTCNNNKNMAYTAHEFNLCSTNSMPKSCTKKYQYTVPAVNLLVLKAPSLLYVLPLQCFFYSLDKPTVEPAKDKSYKYQITGFSENYEAQKFDIRVKQIGQC